VHVLAPLPAWQRTPGGGILRRRNGFGSGPCRAAGVGEQHQGEESGDFAIFGQAVLELSGQADRLRGELDPRQRGPGAGRVAPVEYQGQHVEHRGDPLGTLTLGGIRNSAPVALIRCLARLMRWAAVASGTRRARAISAVVSPGSPRCYRCSTRPRERSRSCCGD
jgi:hypothetical protein